MKLLNYELEGRMGLAALIGGSYYDVGSWARAAGSDLASEVPLTLDRALARGALGLLARREDEIARLGEPLPEPRKLPTVISPEKILMVAVNYAAHGSELHSAQPGEPYFFAKFRNALVGDGGHIYIPRSSRKVDWEVELAVIIGNKCKYVSAGDALKCVAGYTIAVDVSFRDLQYGHSARGYGPNWIKGKALDHSLPLGPWLVTADEFGDPHDVDLRLYVNGELKQNGNTRDMIFPVERLIEYISDGITLEPGDVISTGTPPGVGAGTDGPYLKPGDVVVSEIERIGRMENRVYMDPLLGRRARGARSEREQAVLGQVLGDGVHVGLEACQYRVARYDADDAPLIRHEHAPYPPLGHELGDVGELLPRVDRHYSARHYLLHLCPRRVQLLGQEPAHDVPLRHYAHVLAGGVPHDRESAPVPRHQVHELLAGGARLDEQYPALHDVPRVERHACEPPRLTYNNFPRAFRGSTRPAAARISLLDCTGAAPSAHRSRSRGRRARVRESRRGRDT